MSAEGRSSLVLILEQNPDLKLEIVDMPHNPPTASSCSQTVDLQTHKEKPMKNLIRLVVLVIGLASAYVALAAPVTAAPDGGPMPLCRPGYPCNY